MVPNKFSMVDLEGIDIVESQGIEIPGLYQKLTDAIMQCRYQVIYNWKFDGILIPPANVEMSVVNNEVKINSRISVTDEDILHIYSLEIPAILEELNVTSNGTYTPPEGVDGYDSVFVDVQPPLEEITITENGEYLPSEGYYGIGKVIASIMSGVPLLTRAEWDALTTQEKQSYNLVAIQDAISGFNRGELVYGADYIPVSEYIPYSDPAKIVCEANVANFDSGLTWGDGDKPVTFSSIPSIVDGAVSIPIKTNPMTAYVDLGADNTPFTAYVVMKLVSPTTYARAISASAARSAGKSIMLFGSPVQVSSWASDTSTGISGTDYFVGVIQFVQSGSAKGTVYNHSIISKAPTQVGRYIALGRTDILPDVSTDAPCDIMVKYVAVVEDVDSDSAINQNLQHLYNTFIQGG